MTPTEALAALDILSGDGLKYVADRGDLTPDQLDEMHQTRDKALVRLKKFLVYRT